MICYVYVSFEPGLEQQNKQEDILPKKFQHVLLIYQSNVMLIFNVRSLGAFCFANVWNFVLQVCSRLSDSFTFIFIGVVSLTIRQDKTLSEKAKNQFSRVWQKSSS